MAGTPILEIQGLFKRYHETTAVHDLHLRVDEGDIYGFLGPNGAGKTTTLRIVLGLLEPSEGSVLLFGRPIHEAREHRDLRRQIGAVLETQHLYDDMTAEEYLVFFGQVYGVKAPLSRADQLLKRVGLHHRRRHLIGTFSKGMRQRLAIARALLHQPKLLILDEPVTGLDPHGVKAMRDILLEEHDRGCTLMVASHVLSEVERLCTRVGIMHGGRLVAEGDVAGLKRSLQPTLTLRIRLNRTPPELPSALAALPGVRVVSAVQHQLVLQVHDDDRTVESVVLAIIEAGAVPLELTPETASLEDTFLRLTQENVHRAVQELAPASGA